MDFILDKVEPVYEREVEVLIERLKGKVQAGVIDFTNSDDD